MKLKFHTNKVVDGKLGPLVFSGGTATVSTVNHRDLIEFMAVHGAYLEGDPRLLDKDDKDEKDDVHSEDGPPSAMSEHGSVSVEHDNYPPSQGERAPDQADTPSRPLRKKAKVKKS